MRGAAAAASCSTAVRFCLGCEAPSRRRLAGVGHALLCAHHLPPLHNHAMAAASHLNSMRCLILLLILFLLATLYPLPFHHLYHPIPRCPYATCVIAAAASVRGCSLPIPEIPVS